jgi:hypothetical protein
MGLKNQGSREKRLNIEPDELAWFDTCPDAGDPDCICSYCSFVVQDDDDLIRFWRKGYGEFVPRAYNSGFLVPILKRPKHLEDKIGEKHRKGWKLWYEKSEYKEARLHEECLRILTT